MRLTLSLDPDDLRPLEDTLTRALVRAFRTIARDFPALHLLATASEAPPPAEISPAPPAAPEPAPLPAFGAHLTRSEPPTASRPPPGPATATAQPAVHKHHRKMRDVVRCVADRPDGYYPRSDAAAWLTERGVNNPEPILSKWILGGEIAAVIVTDGPLPPSKGLPGRLYVSRADLKARDKLRVEQMPARWRSTHGAHPGGVNGAALAPAPS